MQTFLENKLSLGDEAVFRETFLRPSCLRAIVEACGGYERELPELMSSFEAIACPVLALWSRAGHHFDSEHAKELVRTVPRATYRPIDGAHWAVFERSTEVAIVVDTFVRTLDV
jgi:pimeloyl-ACP methyl ester carboxylesterase